ncbi:MAG: hypothetical protein ABJP70_01705 [Erythrobacter sp.]
MTLNDIGSPPLSASSITKIIGFGSASVISGGIVQLDFASQDGLAQFDYVLVDSTGATDVGSLLVETTGCSGPPPP